VTSEPSDEELFARHIAGDPAAFDQLVDRYAPRLLGLMRRSVSKREHAEELVQETFMHLHRSAADFEQGRDLRPWLMTIALNTRREYVRRRVRRPEAELELDGRNDPVARDPRWADRRDARKQVHAALATLSDGQREVIELHWLAGLSMAEVAAAVGASLSAVKVRAHRGYKAMRRALAGQG